MSARLRLPSGDTTLLFPGDIIGRLWRAELQINHPAVSGLHAYLSHRDGRLWLLPLRGQLQVHGLSAREVALRPGLVVTLAPALPLTVVSIHLPAELSALSIDGRLHPLTQSRFTLSTELVPGPAGATDALADCWTTGQDWYLQARGGERVRLEAEPELDLEGHRLRLVDVRSSSAEAQPTLDPDRADALHLIVHYETVQIRRDGSPVALFSGLQARALSLLAEFGGPVHWQVVANELWRRADDTQRVRRRWDRLLWALRRRLRSEGIRQDLVMSKLGQVDLVLYAADTVDLRT